jgi:hypothetical protein
MENLEIVYSIVETENSENLQNVKKFLETKFSGDVKSFVKTHRDFCFDGSALSALNSLLDFNELDRKDFLSLESDNLNLLELVESKLC